MVAITHTTKAQILEWPRTTQSHTQGGPNVVCEATPCKWTRNVLRIYGVAAKDVYGGLTVQQNPGLRTHLLGKS